MKPYPTADPNRCEVCGVLDARRFGDNDAETRHHADCTSWDARKQRMKWRIEEARLHQEIEEDAEQAE